MKKENRYYRTLLIYYASSDDDDSGVLDALFSEGGKDYAKEVLNALKEALKEEPFDWEYVKAESNRIPPGKGSEAAEEEYRAWMEDVLRQLEERVG